MQPGHGLSGFKMDRTSGFQETHPPDGAHHRDMMGENMANIQNDKNTPLIKGEMFPKLNPSEKQAVHFNDQGDVLATAGNIFKRAYKRSNIKARVEFYPLTNRKDAETHTGILRNHSVDGLYLETNQAVEKKTLLMLRVLGQFQTGANAESFLRSVYVAEVKWHLRLENKDEILYGIGLKNCKY